MTIKETFHLYRIIVYIKIVGKKSCLNCNDMITI